MQFRLWTLLCLLQLQTISTFILPTFSFKPRTILSTQQSENNEDVEYDPLGLPLVLFPSTLIIETVANSSVSSPVGEQRRRGKFRYPGTSLSRAGDVTTKSDKISSASGFFELHMMNKTQFSFDKVGGFEEIKQELHQLKDMMIHSDKYMKWNVRTPRGLLLHGSPGSGKTFLAKCFAGECELGLIAVSGSEFQEKYVGVGQSRIRELFQFARQQAPCIIFIDEIDAVARQRSGEGELAQAERDATVNQLLVEMDGIFSQSESPIFVIGSTNRKDVLDPALLRAGRMDKKLLVPTPCERVRQQIVDIHLVDKPIVVNQTWVASELTQGMNGAQIEHLLNEASLFGIRHNILPINETLLEQIHEMIQMELPSEYLMTPFPPKPFDPETAYRIAIHEMGHVLMALLSPKHDQPLKCTIETPSIEMLGYTLFQQSSSSPHVRDVRSFLVTKEELIEQISVLLGGRIAEEIVLGSSSVSSGASADLQRVRKIVYDMILQYGMGSKCIYPFHGDVGKSQIDQMATRIIHQTYEHTKQSLTRYKHVLEEMAQLLVQEKTLYYEDFYPLFLQGTCTQDILT